MDKMERNAGQGCGSWVGALGKGAAGSGKTPTGTDRRFPTFLTDGHSWAS